MQIKRQTTLHAKSWQLLGLHMCGTMQHVWMCVNKHITGWNNQFNMGGCVEETSEQVLPLAEPAASLPHGAGTPSACQESHSHHNCTYNTIVSVLHPSSAAAPDETNKAHILCHIGPLSSLGKA